MDVVAIEVVKNMFVAESFHDCPYGWSVITLHNIDDVKQQQKEGMKYALSLPSSSRWRLVEKWNMWAHSAETVSFVQARIEKYWQRTFIVSHDNATASVPDQCLRKGKGRYVINLRMNYIMSAFTCYFTASCDFGVSSNRTVDSSSSKSGCKGWEDAAGVCPLILLTFEWLGWRNSDQQDTSYMHEYVSHSKTFRFPPTDPHLYRKSTPFATVFCAS